MCIRTPQNKPALKANAHMSEFHMILLAFHNCFSMATHHPSSFPQHPFPSLFPLFHHCDRSLFLMAGSP